MVETEPLPRPGGQPAPIVPGGLQQRIGSDDIGPDEVAGRVDRTVDVGFGGEVHHRIRPEFTENPVQFRPVADVGPFKPEPVRTGNLRQRFEVARVSQFVDHADPFLRLADQIPDQCGADESGAAGHQNISAVHPSTPVVMLSSYR